MGIALILFAELTGFYTLMSYTVTTFEKVDTTIDPYKSSITLAVVLTFGSLTTATLADKLGRKAFLGAALGLFTVAGHHYAVLSDYDLSSYAWVPWSLYQQLSSWVRPESYHLKPFQEWIVLECLPCVFCNGLIFYVNK